MGRTLELSKSRLSVSSDTPIPDENNYSPFSSFTDDELIFIVTSTSRLAIAHGLPKLKPIIDAVASQKTNANPVSTQKITQSLLAAITDTPGYYLLVASGLTVMCALTLPIIALAVISAVFTLATIASAFYKIYINYVGLAYKKKMKTSALELLALRYEAFKDLNIRIKPARVEIPPELIDRRGQAEEDAEEDKINHGLLKMLVHDTAAMVITTLTLTFLASVPPILLAVGLTAATAALCSPVGLVVAGTIILLTTTFFAYKQYCLIKNEHAIDRYQRKLETGIENEQKLYEFYRKYPGAGNRAGTLRNKLLVVVPGSKPPLLYGVDSRFSVFTARTRRPAEQQSDINPDDNERELQERASRVIIGHSDSGDENKERATSFRRSSLT